jgi:hypothetical protein
MHCRLPTTTIEEDRGHEPMTIVIVDIGIKASNFVWHLPDPHHISYS